MKPLRSSAAVAAFLLLATVARPAQELRSPPTARDRAHAMRAGWDVAAGEIGETLASCYRPGRSGVAGSVGNPAFRAWLRLHQWAELLARDEISEVARMLGHFLFTTPEGGPARPIFVGSGQMIPADAVPISEDSLRGLVRTSGIPPALAKHILPRDYRLRAGSLASGLDSRFLEAMTGDEEFLDTFLAQLSPRDFTPAVLSRLEEIWKAEPEAWNEYRNLALAIALVTDQRPPEWWPHPQVRAADVPRADLSAATLYRWWRDANESGRLLLDLRRMDAGELKFVVDAPVAQSELEWAQTHARYPRAQFGRAFSAIVYRDDRLESGMFDWNEGPYTLEAISRLGGICVDQAYFAMIAGKARGLPTLFFTGQGTDGGHAWFGYLKAERRWDMDCGRYENQNYAVGEALDPQTWLPINDHELVSLAGSFRQTPQFVASQADVAVARLFERMGDLDRASAALDSAISLCPKNEAAWAAQAALLERREVAIRERKAFHEAALKQFANNKDIKVTHQRALASLARSSGDEKTARRVEAGIISQNRRGRADLSVSAASSQLRALMDAGDLDQAMRTYRELLGRLGRTGGGGLFYHVVDPFTRELARRGDGEAAARCLALARNALRPESESILDQDIAELEKELAGEGRAAD